MIEFNVAQLLKEPVGSDRTYKIEEDTPLTALEKDSFQGWHGNVYLVRTDKGILAKAALDSTTACTCSRCLSTYFQPIHILLEEEFFPTIQVDTGLKVDLDMIDEEDFLIDHNHILDMTEAIRQYAIVAVPMKPLCGEKCAGLCPSCGVNLNEQNCQCPKTQSDPLWGSLSEILSHSKQ